MVRIYLIIMMNTSIACAIPVDSKFSDDVLFRLYCINRIRPSIKIIKKLDPGQLLVVDKPMVLLGGIYKNKNVLQLWDDLRYYKYLEDDLFSSYVLWRILLVLVRYKKISYSTLQKNCDEINIEELLSAIDVVVSNVHHINQHYHDSGLSFAQWLKQYWWIPSILISSIFIKVIKYCYLHSRQE